MNNIILLTKVFLKNATFQKNKVDDTKNKKILKIIGLIILFSYVAGVFGVLSYQIIEMLNEVNQPALFLGVLLLSISTLVLIQSVASAMNLLYFSKDIVNVLPLPIKPYQIIVAKFNVLVITEYMVITLFALAPFIIYGILTGAGILLYIYGMLVLLIFPIFPAIISSFIVMIIMSFTKTVKNKEKFQVIGTFLAIGLVLIIQFIFSGQEEMQTEQLVEMLTKANGLLDIIDNYFITLSPAMNVLTEYNIISLMELIIITLISYFIFVIIAKKIYLRGVVGVSSSGKENRKIGLIGFKKKPIAIRYIKKEFTMLYKNPVYFIQCVLPSILMPIIFAGAILLNTNENDLLEMQQVDINSTIGILIILGIITFLISLIFVPVTAVSRDGKNAVFMKYIPVSLYEQFIYKIVPSIFLSIVLIFIALGIMSVYFKMSIFIMLMAFINGLIISIFYAYIMLIIDLKRPKLNWDTEYAVVKQNFNMIFCFAFSIAYILLLTIIGIFLLEQNVIFISILILIFNITILFAIDRYVRINQEKLLEKINI